jgi:hypothetical protein
VRHRLGHLDQRLHAAERFGQREDLRGGRDARGLGVAERDHPAEARPAHVLDAVGPAQELAGRAPVPGVRGHAEVERPQPPVDEEAVERPEHRSGREL